MNTIVDLGKKKRNKSSKERAKKILKKSCKEQSEKVQIKKVQGTMEESMQDT